MDVTLAVITLFWTGFSEVSLKAESTVTVPPPSIEMLPLPRIDWLLIVLILVPLTNLSCLPWIAWALAIILLSWFLTVVSSVDTLPSRLVKLSLSALVAKPVATAVWVANLESFSSWLTLVGISEALALVWRVLVITLFCTGFSEVVLKALSTVILVPLSILMLPLPSKLWSLIVLMLVPDTSLSCLEARLDLSALVAKAVSRLALVW